MNRCLICYKPIEETFTSVFEKEKKICLDCFYKFKIRNSKSVIEGIEYLILYYYDDFFKQLLYQYKGCYDYVLKDAFLTYNLEKIRKKYKGYKVAIAPSNEEVNQRRGYKHLKEIFLNLGLEIIDCFSKEKEWKQSDKKYEERKQIQNIIKIDKSMLYGVKKLLLVDDVLTSGSTIKSMIRLVPTNIDIKVLILSSNCRILANEIC